MLDCQDWDWQTASDCQWLTCRLLEPWPHAFGSRHGYPRKPDELAPLQLGLASDSVAWAKQVHGCEVLWATGSSLGETAADAVATGEVGQSVWASSADCVPLLFAHAVGVAAVHSGWRGTAAAIAPKVLQALVDRGASASEIKVALGPAISGPAYQVSQKVAEKVLQTLAAGDREVTRHPDLPTIVYPDAAPGKTRLDLRAAIARQLLQAGIAPEHISISPHCTWSQPESFFSYRRIQNPPTPIQWSGIGSI
jgi:hypothetical protein